MWTLYGSRGSGSAAIEMALLRCGLPFREVRASSWEADSAHAELRALNPLGQIPTLVDPAGVVLTESAAILLHLGLLVPGSGLLPADASQRAQVMRGLVFVAANCYADISIIDYPERWLPEAKAPAREQLRAGTRLHLHRCWDLFADQFLPVLADARAQAPSASALALLAAVVSRWAGARTHLAANRPALLDLLLAVEAQPDLQPVFRRHWPPAAAH